MSDILTAEIGSTKGGIVYSEAVFPLENQSELQSNQVNLFCRTIDRELFRIMMAPSISEPQAQFVNDVIAATSGLVHSELKIYSIELPEAYGRRGPQETYTNGNGKLLKTATTWFDFSSGTAKGKVKLDVENSESRNERTLRNPIEDFAAGMIHFIRLLSDKNDGLPTDEHMINQLCNMVNSYETLYYPGAFRIHQQELLKRTAHATRIGEAVLNGFLVPSQVK